MPELPEVQTIVDALCGAGIVGLRIRELVIRWPPSIRGSCDVSCRDVVRGRRICGLRRRGKYIGVVLSGGWWLIGHLRMSGRLQIATAGEPFLPQERLRFFLEDGRALVFLDSRKFGRWVLTRRPNEVLERLGPEPLERDFTTLKLKEALRTSRAVKAVLLDQRKVAGIGNIYADEALWAARIHPLRPAAALAHAEIIVLRRAIIRVLKKAIRLGGTSLGRGAANFRGPQGELGGNDHALKVYCRAGKPCARCGGNILRIKVAQRSTHICPACQPMHPAVRRA